MKLFKTKLNSRGFSHVEIGAILGVLLIVTLVGFHAFTAGSKSVANAGSDLSSLFDDPLRNVKHLVPWRIDEGVDYRGVGPVYAIGPAVITDIRVGANGYAPPCTFHCRSRFWGDELGNAVIYKITAGKATGEYIYVAEACNPNPSLHTGEVVNDHTVVCTMFGGADGQSWPGIEMGEWNGPVDNSTPSAKPLAYIHSQYAPINPNAPDGSETAYGVNFNKRMVRLGTPGGNSAGPGHVSTNVGKIIGTVPATWPVTWY